jgi:hypothetical protein
VTEIILTDGRTTKRIRIPSRPGAEAEVLTLPGGGYELLSADEGRALIAKLDAEGWADVAERCTD